MKKILLILSLLVTPLLVGCNNEGITSVSTSISSTTTSIQDNIAPVIDILPAGGYFTGNEQEIHLKISSISEITNMSVRIDGVDLELYDKDSVMTIGENTDVGESISIIVIAENAYGETISKEYIFTKVLPFSEGPLVKIDEFNNLRIYQIYVSAYRDCEPRGYTVGYGPSSYTGDLQGIINSLDYIENLGMNAIWLTPVFESKDNDSLNQWEERGRATGYFADDYYNIDPNFGTNKQFKTLVEEAHSKGLYVFLDGVFGHHGYYDIQGVTDGDSQWYGHQVLYPESLDYFKGVATYWIDEYEIDGWRLDQAYQLYQNGHNYLKDIRQAVEEISYYRKIAGKEWGTLGYVVGEIWNDAYNIEYYGYASESLRSAFNFPLRYALVRALAVDESLYSSTLFDLNSAMSYQYDDYAQPNMFITNHDLIRFGDLLQFADFEDEYYKRHKMAISFLTAYTGPITIYYGDEYGDNFEGLVNSTSDLDSFSYIAPDNVSRSPGYISGFTSEQEDLIEYVRTLMKLREENSCLYNGERTNLLVTNDVYVDKKTDSSGSIIYALNISSETSIIQLNSIDVGGTQLVNLITGEEISSVDGVFTISLEELSGSFFKVE